MKVVRGTEQVAEVLTNRSLYFGYGLEADPEIFETVTGQEATVVFGALEVAMSGFVLAIQKLSQVPLAGDRNPELNPRHVLAENWQHGIIAGEEPEFYTMYPTSYGGRVEGTLYGEMGVDALKRLNAWDMAGDWRFPEFGRISARKTDGSWLQLPIPKVLTYVTGPKQGYDRAVSGHAYPLHLMGENVARQAAEQFAERTSN